MELAGTETVTTIAPNKNNILTRTTKSVTYEPRILKIEQSGLSARQGKIKINTEAKYDLLPETTTTKIPFETTRTAEPLIAAVKGETLYARKIGVGKVSDFLNTPSTGRAAESVKIKTTEVNLRQSSGNKVIDSIKGKFVKDQPSVVLEKTVISGKDSILPTSKTTVREITGIKLTGELTPTENLKIGLKMSNAPKTATEALGRTTIKPAKSTPMKQGTNEAFKKAIELENLRKTNPEKFRVQREAEIKGPSAKGIAAGAIKNEIDDSIGKVLSEIGVSNKNLPTWKDTPTSSEIASKLSGASYRNRSGNAIAQSVSKNVFNTPERVAIKSNIISVNPTKGSAWSTTAAAASSIWGAKQASNQRQRQAAGSNILERAAQNVRSTVETPQRISPVLTTPSVFEPGKIDQSRIIDIPEPQQDRISTPVRWSGPKLPVSIDRPILLDSPKENIKFDSGPVPPIVISKPKPIEVPKEFSGLIRITETPTTQPQTTDIPQIFRTSNVPKRKLQGLTIFPGGGGSGSGGMFGSRKGKWWKTKSPFPEPGQVFKQVLGKKNIDVFKQVKARKVSKKKRASSGSGNRRSRKR